MADKDTEAAAWRKTQKGAAAPSAPSRRRPARDIDLPNESGRVDPRLEKRDPFGGRVVSGKR